MNRREYASLIVQRIRSDQEALRQEFFGEDRIKSFVVDQLLPQDLALEIYKAFPRKEEMVFKHDLRERKYVAVQMDRYHPILEEIVYAFQDSRVVDLLSEITGISSLIPDEHLYAGGISLMDSGNFLNPHLDNSHDHEQNNYRVLNSLYYVTPHWNEEYGGHLELWDRGVEQHGRTIHSTFNRLVVMATGKSSWHSVNKVVYEGQRCCISNYFFAPRSIEGENYFHATSFRGRPEQKAVDWVLRCDGILRNIIRKFFKGGLFRTSHIYRK